MKVLVACEYSGRVRDAFTALGHDATSCDFLPSETPGQHVIGDVMKIIDKDWDLVIAHPPCTHLAASGARWFKHKVKEQEEAIDFALKIYNSFPPMLCLENPIGVLSTKWRKPDQIIQPWQYGHGETKATCLWLRNLPLLQPTEIVEGREPRVHHMPPGPDRWKERSRTYEGVAKAMAEQWGKL